MDNRLGKLCIVATPIGNLSDITFRAVEVLKSVDLIACEDTRHSKLLLDHYGVHKPLVSYHDFSEKRRAPRILEMLKGGRNVALISDAGTPGVADPGYRLIRAAIDEGIRVEALPGACAFLAALVVSGLPMHHFVFEGFLPLKSGQKKAKFLSFRAEDGTVIFYESPHRLLKTLELLRETLGDIEIVVARELTKKFEEVIRKKVSEVIAHFSGKKVQGEYVVLFHRERA